MTNRRQVLRRLAVGAAWMGVSGIAASRVLGANDRIRFGLIGAGARGQAIFRGALRCPNTEAAAVADSYTRRLDEAKAIAPGVTTNCPFEMGYRTAIACQMAVASYRQQRAVRWDAQAEDIV